MKTKNKKETTIGIDLGDKKHDAYALSNDGELISRHEVTNTKLGLKELSDRYPGAVMVMEAGTHSPWVSRYLSELGHEVIVANPRKLRAIYESDNKTDERDAEMLARLGRFDRKLLYSVSHVSERHQRGLSLLRSRDVLVESRTKLINHARGTLKSLGVRLPKTIRAEAFATKVSAFLEATDRTLMEPILKGIQSMTDQIKALEKRLGELAESEFPVAKRLEQELPGVGPLTSLAFVLIIERPERFKKVRDIGPFLGLVPKRDKSGSIDKPMRISKAGNQLMRRLLVNCAQYNLGPFGPDTALRRAGERICKDRGKVAKRKAVIAVARKLSVVMLKLWQNPEAHFEAFPEKVA